MKITARQILGLGRSGVMQYLGAQRVPAETAFRLRRLRRLLNPEFIDLNAARDQLFTTENSSENPAVPGQRILNPECTEAFRAEEALLLDRIIEIAAEPFGPSAFRGVQISEADLEALGPFIDEGEI
jgi:hypothetical protein